MSISLFLGVWTEKSCPAQGSENEEIASLQTGNCFYSVESEPQSGSEGTGPEALPSPEICQHLLGLSTTEMARAIPL